MFYVSDESRKDSYGITDTSDGVTEYYNLAQIKQLIKENGIDIFGVDTSHGKMTCHALRQNIYMRIPMFEMTINHLRNATGASVMFEKRALQKYVFCLLDGTEFGVSEISSKYGEREVIKCEKINSCNWRLDRHMMDFDKFFEYFLKVVTSAEGIAIRSI